jgi:hypothetical protein
MQIEPKSTAQKIIGITQLMRFIQTLPTSHYATVKTPVVGALLSHEIAEMFALAHDDMGFMLAMPAFKPNWAANIPVESLTLDENNLVLSILTEQFEQAPHQVMPAVVVQFKVHHLIIDDLKDAMTIGFAVIENGSITRTNKIFPLLHSKPILVIPPEVKH